MTTEVNDGRIAIARDAVLYALSRCSAVPSDIDDRQLAIIGSTYIADKETADVDVLLTVPLNPNELGFDGWEYGGSTPKCGDAWGSWRRTVGGVDVNLLICGHTGYIERWLTSTEVCRYLHLQGINLRTCNVHAVHAIIMDDRCATDELGRNYG